MNRKTHRVGAYASAAMLFVVLIGTGLTGAFAQDQAQDQAEPIALEQAENISADTAIAPATQVRFVSQPMVQELPAPDQNTAAQITTGKNAEDVSSLRELVSVMPSSGEMSREMYCLAQAVYFESRGEPLSGQLAVARVVINRADSSQFPDDYCSVVTQRAQFSFVRGGHIPDPNTNSRAWSRARAIARIAHQELWDSAAADSLYFHATHVSPRWARAKSARAQIDSHIFYR